MIPARWWHREGADTVVCDLCPRGCHLHEGQIGFCGVRQVVDGGLRALSYGQASGFAVDPVEKKPLYHVLPGSSVLSFGGVGCNLACDFCQNARLSQGAPLSYLVPARPEAVVAKALSHRCPSVAFTYNEPIVSAESAVDTALACREAGLLTMAVTAGTIREHARETFFEAMDAANVDLKSFREAFYRKHCQGHLRPVLETLEHVARRGRTWLEITCLLIPGENDGEDEVREMAAWIATHCGPHIPLHLTAFHPDHRLLNLRSTPVATLVAARAWAQAEGLHHVYLGNVPRTGGSDTRCPTCGGLLIQREGFRVLANRLQGSTCPGCRYDLPGLFAPRFSPPGP